MCERRDIVNMLWLCLYEYVQPYDCFRFPRATFSLTVPQRQRNQYTSAVASTFSHEWIPVPELRSLATICRRRLVVRDWSVLSYRHIPTRCRRVLHSSPPRGLSPSLGRGLRYVSCHPLSLSSAIGRCTNLSTAIRQRLCDHAICTRRRHRLIAKMHISLWIIPSRRRIRLRKLQSS